MSVNDVEYLGKVNPRRLSSFQEDFTKERAEIIADRGHWEKYGTNRSTKSTKSKCQIIEELSRERFSWEE